MDKFDEFLKELNKNGLEQSYYKNLKNRTIADLKEKKELKIEEDYDLLKNSQRIDFARQNIKKKEEEDSSIVKFMGVAIAVVFVLLGIVLLIAMHVKGNEQTPTRKLVEAAINTTNTIGKEVKTIVTSATKKNLSI